ncbi:MULTISPECIES: DUF5134 domain-containing protein [unclassified Streptomyces]|uniref:DUF5134 domain-containing protein n=1 Tax=unclassified Streptomyces TaxID=2593676 RepID=UPI00332524BF
MSTPLVLVHCMLTLLFVVVLLHGLARDVGMRGTGFRVRADRLLRASMALSMAAMPWIALGPGPAAAATGVFTAGAVWFLLPLGRRVGGGTAAVAHRLPHAAGMAAMVWMLRVPRTGPVHDHPGTAAPHLTGPDGLGAAPLHGGAAGTLSLACGLLAYALWSLTRPMPALRSAVSAARRAAAATPAWHVGEGAMALGTAVMLVLPH